MGKQGKPQEPPAPKSASAQAEARRGAANAKVTACEATVAAVTDEIATAHGALDRMTAANEVDHDHVVAEENGRRRLRKLEGQQADARAQLADAVRELEDANHGAAVARRDDKFEELAALNKTFIATAKAAKAQLGATLAAFVALKEEVHALDYELSPRPTPHSSPREGFNLLTSLIAWSTPALLAGHQVLEAAATHERAGVVEEQHRLARERGSPPYAPPVSGADWTEGRN